MRIPLDRCFPRAFRWLHMLGLDHILEFKSRIRVMLMLSSLISLYFCITWLLDVVQLACLSYTPWSDQTQHACLMHLIGGVVMFFMFQTSGMVLAYYDEDGEQLWEKKNRTLTELSKQTGEVLQRATNQARKLCGMLNLDLGDKVREHVFRMRKILEMVQRDKGAAAPQLYRELLTQMARHLHRLRQPAIEHFSKLISLSQRSTYLYKELTSMKMQSMVELLSNTEADTRPVPRTETAIGEDVELGVGSLLGISSAPAAAVAAYIPSFSAVSSLALCENPGDIDEEEVRTSHVDVSMRLPDEDDLREELKVVSAAERVSNPERIVLRPLRLVLTWFEKIGTSRGRPSAADAGAGAGALARMPTRTKSAKVFTGPMDQLKEVIRHLRRSAFYRSILIGIGFSTVFLMYDLYMLLVIIGVMQDGHCGGGLVIQCTGAVVRQALNVAAMLCYMVSLTVVLWNVERLDNVLKVQEEIQQMEDFKHQIDQLNAHQFQDEDTSISMLQTVETQLTEQKRIISRFFNDDWGQQISLERYRQLVVDLREALETPVLSPAAPSGEGAKEEPRVTEHEDAPLLAGVGGPGGTSPER